MEFQGVALPCHVGVEPGFQVADVPAGVPAGLFTLKVMKSFPPLDSKDRWTHSPLLRLDR